MGRHRQNGDSIDGLIGKRTLLPYSCYSHLTSFLYAHGFWVFKFHLLNAQINQFLNSAADDGDTRKVGGISFSIASSTLIVTVHMIYWILICKSISLAHNSTSWTRTSILIFEVHYFVFMHPNTLARCRTYQRQAAFHHDSE